LNNIGYMLSGNDRTPERLAMFRRPSSTRASHSIGRPRISGMAGPSES
jgi:hypothetical protein